MRLNDKCGTHYAINIRAPFSTTAHVSAPCPSLYTVLPSDAFPPAFVALSHKQIGFGVMSKIHRITVCNA